MPRPLAVHGSGAHDVTRERELEQEVALEKEHMRAAWEAGRLYGIGQTREAAARIVESGSFPRRTAAVAAAIRALPQQPWEETPQGKQTGRWREEMIRRWLGQETGDWVESLREQVKNFKVYAEELQRQVQLLQAQVDVHERQETS